MSQDKEINNAHHLGISLNKPHLLIEGELEWWLAMTRNYIQQTDYQCWLIIENGDEKVTAATPQSPWGPAEYAMMEKNAKARQLILNSL